MYVVFFISLFSFLILLCSYSTLFILLFLPYYYIFPVYTYFFVTSAWYSLLMLHIILSFEWKATTSVSSYHRLSLENFSFYRHISKFNKLWTFHLNCWSIYTIHIYTHTQNISSGKGLTGSQLETAVRLCTEKAGELRKVLMQ